MEENNQKDSIGIRLAAWLVRRSSIYAFMFEMSDWLADDTQNKTITAKDEPDDTLR
jgi:hypothetical protein